MTLEDDLLGVAPSQNPQLPDLSLQDPKKKAQGVDPGYSSLMHSSMAAAAQNDAVNQVDPQGPQNERPVDPAFSLLLEQDEETQRQGDAAVMRALLAASKVDPELAGEAQRLGIDLGVAPELLEANIGKARELWQRKQVEALFASGGNQQTISALLDPTFARIASDDVQQLSWLENIWQQRDAAKLEERQSLLWDQVRQGSGTPAIMREIEGISEQLVDLPGSSNVGGFFESLTYGAMRTWSGMEETLLTSLGVGAAMGGTALALGQAGPQVALPEEIISVPGMFSAGFFGTLSVSSAAREAGASYGSMIEMGIDPAIARRWSTGVGIVNGALEAISAGVLSAPFRAEAKRLMTRQVAKEMLTKPTRTAGAIRFATTYAKGIGAEVATEVMQEISNVVGESIARWQQEDKTTLKETDPFFERMGHIIGETLRGMALLGLPGPMMQLRTDMARAKTADYDEKWVSSLGKGVDKSKTRPRNRRLFARFLEQLAEGTDAEAVHVSFEDFTKMLDESDMTVQQLAEFAPEIAARLKESEQTGSVEIPTSEFGAEFLSTDFGKTLIPHARIDPGGISPAEAAKVSAKERAAQATEAEQLLKKFGEKDSAYKEQADLIEQRFEESMIAAGRKPAEAKTAARYYRNMALILASEEGLSPAQWQQQQGTDLLSEEDFDALDMAADTEAIEAPDLEQLVDEDVPTPTTTTAPGTLVRSETFPNARGVMIGESPGGSIWVAWRKNLGKDGKPLDEGKPVQSLEEWADDINTMRRSLARLQTKTRRPRGPELNQLKPAKGKKPKGDLTVGGKNLTEGNVLGFWEKLRVKAPTRKKLDKGPILAGTNNANAQRQIDAIDGILEAHPNAHESAAAWSNMMAEAFGSQEVPVPPFAFIRDLVGNKMAKKLGVLSKGQLDDANHGFANAAEFRRAYLAGEIDVATTGKLFLWSFLSRGVSPYTQESMFIDSFDGAAEWIEKAARGEFTEADLEAYHEWTATTAPKGSGQPGSSSMHNLNAFGASFLLKMGQRRADGKTHLQHLHDLMATEGITGKQIRREFQTFGEGVGIDNKVVSFTLLVAGFDDVMVLDRVQVRQLWDDGRFNGYNLYDGINESRMVKGKEKRVKITGSSLTELTMGVRGLLVYEALERVLATKVQAIYAELGRPQDASIGRFHWESWVADSQQEASHGTLGAVLEDAKGHDTAIAQVTAKEGEYSAFEYGARYGRDESGEAYFLYEVPQGNIHRFTVAQFRAFLDRVKKRGAKVIPKGFRLTPPKKGPIPPEYSKPWYLRDGVNTARLEELAVEFTEGEQGRPAAAQAAGQERGAAAGGARSAAAAGVEQRQVEAQRAGRFLPDLRVILLDAEHATPSTVFHELSHFWFFSMLDMVARGVATDRVRGDIDTLLQWFGIEGADIDERFNNWDALGFDKQKKHHESLAYNYEVYLFDGKAPSSKLEKVFAKIRTFMLAAYENIRDQLNAIYYDNFGTNLPGLTPEVRMVFDRMLASKQAVESAESARAMRPVFQTIEEFTAAGYTEEQWLEYQAVIEEAHEEAVTDLTAATLRQLKWLRNARSRILKQKQREADKMRRKVEKEVQAELDDDPTYIAMGLLRGEKAAGKIRESEVDTLLADLPAKLREQIKKKLGTGRRGVLSKNGLAADGLAEILGYRSGEEMLRDFFHAKPIDEELELRTTKRMLDEHSELTDKKAIDEAIDRALHNEARARFVATELKFLDNSGRPARVMIAAAKDAARKALGGRKVKDIRPDRFSAQEARAARKAEQAMKKGDPAEAVQGKREQLLLNQMAHMAYKARDEVAKILGGFRKLMRSRDRLSKMGNVDVLMAAKWLLAQYGLATQATLEKATDYLALLKQYDPVLFARLEPELAKAQMRGRELGRLKNGAPNWRELTLDELRVVQDTVDTLVFRAQRDRQIKVGNQMEELDTVVDTLVGRMKIPAEVHGETGALSWWTRAKLRLLGTRANLIKLEHYLRAMDGGEQGPFLTYLFNEVRMSVDEYRSDASVYVKKLVDLVTEMRKRGLLDGGKIDAKELNYSFGEGNRGNGMAELIGALLHMGNLGNKERFLVAGRGGLVDPNTKLSARTWADIDADGQFDYSRWDAFLARMIESGRLKREHFDFAQKVWDLMEEIKPKLQESHRELDGSYFHEVKPEPFTMEFKDGQTVDYRGGYVPAARDTDLLPPGELKLTVEEMQADFFNGLPQVPDGMTKERAARYNKRPLAMDINRIGAHIDESLRYAHVQPRVADVLRIIGNEKFATAMDRVDHNAIRELFIPYLERAVRQSVYDKGKDPTQDAFWKMIRRNTGVAIMFGNVVNSMQQLTGISNSLLYVEGRHLRGALYTYMRERGDLADAIIEKSEFMDDRLRNQMMGLTADLRELLLDPTAAGRMQEWVGRKAYFLQSFMQNQVDIVTWWGGYQQAIEKGLMERDAVIEANSAVRLAQGSFNPEDVAGYEVGTPLSRTWTQFTSYFNTVANQVGFAKESKVRATVLAFSIPMIAAQAIAMTLWGQWDDEDDDGHWDTTFDLFVGSQMSGAAAMVPGYGPALYGLAAQTFGEREFGDKVAASPAMVTLGRSLAGFLSTASAMVNEDKNLTGRGLRDGLTAVVLLVPGAGVIAPAIRPTGFLTDVATGKVNPTGPVDVAFGVLTGRASEASRK